MIRITEKEAKYIQETMPWKSYMSYTIKVLRNPEDFKHDDDPILLKLISDMKYENREPIGKHKMRVIQNRAEP